MLQILKNQFQMTVLRLSLDRSTRPAYHQSSALVDSASNVIFELESQSTSLAVISCSSTELGIPTDIQGFHELSYRDVHCTLPPYVVNGLQDLIATTLKPGEPLWLELSESCGNLPMVPWEKTLQQVTTAPILRLPFFPVLPVATTEVLNIGICASSPIASRPIAIASLVPTMVRRILKTQSQQPTYIDIFADQDAYEALVLALNDLATAPNSTLRIHPPPEASEIDPSTLDRSGSEDFPGSGYAGPWLNWVTSGLAGRSLDVAHFICHGYLSGDQGAIVLAESPAHVKGEQRPLLVGPQQLSAFLAQFGIWSVGFSSPPRTLSMPGLRLLADQIARQRPGPVLVHDFALDRAASKLDDAYRFLYSTTPQAPPASPYVTVYSHPSRLGAQLPMTLGGGDEETTEFAESAWSDPSAPLIQEYTLAKGETRNLLTSTENTPDWIAASQRYLEQSVAEVFGNTSSDNTQSTLSKGKEDALKFLSDAVARHAIQQGSPEKEEHGG